MQPTSCLLGTEHEQWWAQSLPQLKSSQSKLSGKPSCLHSSAMLQKCQNKFFLIFLWYEVISKSMILNLLPFWSTLVVVGSGPWDYTFISWDWVYSLFPFPFPIFHPHTHPQSQSPIPIPVHNPSPQFQSQCQSLGNNALSKVKYVRKGHAAGFSWKSNNEPKQLFWRMKDSVLSLLAVLNIMFCSLLYRNNWTSAHLQNLPWPT